MGKEESAIYWDSHECAPHEFNKAMKLLMGRFVGAYPSATLIAAQHQVCAVAVPYNGLGSRSTILVSLLLTYSSPAE